MHGASIEAMHLAHQEQPKTFSSKMFKKITKEGKQSFGAWIQEIRSYVSRYGLDMFQGSQRLLKMCQRYSHTSSTKTPKNDHDKNQKKEKIHIWERSDIRIWSLDYFTMCYYKPLLIDHKLWIEKSSIKETLLPLPLFLALTQKFST